MGIVFFHKKELAIAISVQELLLAVRELLFSVWSYKRYSIAIIYGIVIISYSTIALAYTSTSTTFSPAEQEALAQVEAYLNGIGTIRARFIQVSGAGVHTEGTIFILRPGHMRLEYDPPSSILVIADGQYLIYHDAKLEQTSYLKLDTTPASLMLQVPVHLDGNITVTDIRRVSGIIEVSLTQTRDPEVGELTLLFEEHPFALKQWRVKDAQSQIVTVTLYKTETNVKLKKSMFKFTDPNFFKPYN